MTLLNTFSTVFSPDVMSRIAMYVDESAEKTEKAVDGLIFTILGGLMKRTTTEIGVNQLYNHIQRGRYDGHLLESLEQTLRDPAHTNTLITQGNDVISHLLPAMKSSIGNMISTYAGIRNSSAISLLGLTTTVVLHVLGRRVKDNKLDADGVASLLFAERDAFINAVPDEFMPRLVDKVGLQQIVGGSASPARRSTVEASGRPVSSTRATATTRPAVAYDPADESDNDTSSLAKWGVGALLALAIAAGGYYVYKNTQSYAGGGETVSEVSSTSNDSVQTADTVARSLAVPVDSAAKTTPRSTSAVAVTTATGVAVGAPPTVAGGNLTQQMTPYLGNTALPKGRVFPLTGITFLPGSLSMTPGSQATVSELATLLKTYPGMQIQLIGYANDAPGGALTNKSLSFKRVNQIKQQLMASGVNYLRVDAIGRGTGITRRDTSGIARPALKKIDVKVVMK